MITLSPQEYAEFSSTIRAVQKQILDWIDEGKLEIMAIDFATADRIQLDFPIQIPYQTGYISSSLFITPNKTAWYAMYIQETDTRRKKGRVGASGRRGIQ